MRFARTNPYLLSASLMAVPTQVDFTKNIILYPLQALFSPYTALHTYDLYDLTTLQTF